MEETTLKYYYCWRGIITITLNTDGDWWYNYSVPKFFEYLNAKRVADQNWNIRSVKDCFYAGVLYGRQLDKLLLECKESYEKTESTKVCSIV